MTTVLPHDRRPRVGIDAGALMMHARAPGTARFVKEQVQELLSRPLPWDWVVAVPEGYESDLVCPEGSEIVGLPGRKYSFFAMFRAPALWRERQCSVGFSPAGIAAFFSPLLCNYFDSNIFEYGWTWASSGEWLRSHVLRWLAVDAFRRAQRVFVNSHYCAEYLKRRFPKWQGKFIVNHGILNPSAVVPERPAWADDSMEQGGIVLCSSAFSDNKNQRRLIEAYCLMQEAGRPLPQLVLIGPCPLSYFKQVIEPLRNKSRHPERIVIPGYVNEGVLAWAFEHANVLVQPSFAEGFSSLAVFQAMRLGVPVACANTTSHPEAVGEAALMFDPTSVPDMAVAIQCLLDNRDVRERLRKRGFSRVAELSWMANTECVCAHLSEVLNLSSSQGTL